MASSHAESQEVVRDVVCFGYFRFLCPVRVMLSWRVQFIAVFVCVNDGDEWSR